MCAYSGTLNSPQQSQPHQMHRTRTMLCAYNFRHPNSDCIYFLIGNIKNNCAVIKYRRDDLCKKLYRSCIMCMKKWILLKKSSQHLLKVHQYIKMTSDMNIIHSESTESPQPKKIQVCAPYKNSKTSLAMFKGTQCLVWSTDV